MGSDIAIPVRGRLLCFLLFICRFADFLLRQQHALSQRSRVIAPVNLAQPVSRAIWIASVRFFSAYTSVTSPPGVSKDNLGCVKAVIPPHLSGTVMPKLKWKPMRNLDSHFL